MHPYRRIRIFSYSHPLCCAALQVGLNLKLPDSIGIRITFASRIESETTRFNRNPYYTARDLNLDGRRELVIEYAGGIGDGGGGQSSTSLLLLDFNAQGPKIWGSLPVNDAAFGPDGEVFRQAAYVVQVEKGKTPRFQGLFLKTLSKSFAEREQYAATGKVVPLKLDPTPPFKLTRLW